MCVFEILLLLILGISSLKHEINLRKEESFQ